MHIRLRKSPEGIGEPLCTCSWLLVNDRSLTPLGRGTVTLPAEQGVPATTEGLSVGTDSDMWCRLRSCSLLCSSHLFSFPHTQPSTQAIWKKTKTITGSKNLESKKCSEQTLVVLEGHFATRERLATRADRSAFCETAWCTYSQHSEEWLQNEPRSKLN